MNKHYSMTMLGGLLLGLMAVTAQAAREEMDLSSANWTVWLDRQAAWSNDVLYPPGEADLAKLPVNAPSGGWAAQSGDAKTCTLPACVESLFSGGVPTWSYHGVSWFMSEVEIPAAWKGRTVRLQVEQARLRCELYVNGKLAGYDLVAETPFAFEVSKFLEYGRKNRIAFRLTNPGGTKDLTDAPVAWGVYTLPSARDYAGLGRVRAVASEAVYIEDMFVKNLPPAGGGKVEVRVTLHNASAGREKLSAEILDAAGKVVATERWETEAGAPRTARAMMVPDAKMWSPETPVLYSCRVSVAGNDTLTTPFGVRVWETRMGENDEGGHNFYLNGRRIRPRGAVDGGYYGRDGWLASEAAAKRSVSNAKAMGLDALRFSGRMADPAVLSAADEQGLLIQDEPGAFHGFYDTEFGARVAEEKVRRMVLRDRNHPGVWAWNLSSSDNENTPVRERIFRVIRELDDSRLVYNGTESSMVPARGQPYFTRHVRPYESQMGVDLMDGTAIGSYGLKYALLLISGTPYSTGPGRDLLQHPGLAQRFKAALKEWNMGQSGTRTIRTAENVLAAAAFGLYYTQGRLIQPPLCNPVSDAVYTGLWADVPGWSCGLCDADRNLKGSAADFRVWRNRPRSCWNAAPMRMSRSHRTLV